MKKHPLDPILFFRQARLVAALSNGQRPGKKMGAVLFKGRNQLAYGCNLFNKTHTLQAKYLNKQFLHAEINCLLKRRHYDDIGNCSMLVYREDGEGNPVLAKPCINCQTIMKEFGIKKVYYSIPNEPYYEIVKL